MICVICSSLFSLPCSKFTIPSRCSVLLYLLSPFSFPSFEKVPQEVLCYDENKYPKEFAHFIYIYDFFSHTFVDGPDVGEGGERLEGIDDKVVEADKLYSQNDRYVREAPE